MKRALQLVLIGALALPKVAQAQEWQPKNLPVTTQDDISKADPANLLCSKIEKALQQSFLGNDEEIRLPSDFSDSWYIEGITSYYSNHIPNSAIWMDSGFEIRMWSLWGKSLPGVGKEREALMISRGTIRGNDYFDVRRFTSAKAMLKAILDDKTDVSGQQEFSAYNEVPQIFKSDGHDYLLASYGEGARGVNSFELNQFIYHAPSQKVCAWKLYPSQPADFLKSQSADAIVAYVDKLDSIMINHVPETLGVQQEMLNAFSIAEAHNSYFWLAFRPWALGQLTDNYSTSSLLTEENFLEWSMESILNNHDYNEVVALRPAAKAELRAYYKNNFSFEMSDEKLNELVVKLAAKYIYFVPQQEYQNSNHNLKELLFAPAPDFSKIEIELNKLKSKDMGINEIGENALFFAVKNPQLLEWLLNKGIPVDSKNDIQKTPLMYAAEFNQLETVKMLLAHGADVNSRTLNELVYGIPEYDLNKTPLMYAAQFASKEMIELLLKAKANKEGASHYLALNPHFDDTQRAALIEKWQLP